MAKNGPRPLPESVKQARGTAQPCRERSAAVVTLDGDPVRPKWLTADARLIWDEKVAIYKARQQQVRGCEGPLAQYCALEAEIVRRWKKEIDVPAAMINTHRIYAGEFFDTPGSHQGPKRTAADNPFKNNGRRAGLALVRGNEGA